jgi:radical SAM superfamily enzyme YgiQ (UPF0313 family)
MQNPTAIRHYVDWAVYGRAHEWVHLIVGDILAGRDPVHPSVQDMKIFNPVRISQDGMIPFPIDDWTEDFTGCPHKCKFCHFTWSRKHQGSSAAYDEGGTYYQHSLSDSSPEVTWPQLLTWPKKVGRIRVAIDGMSERLRFLFGKPIRDSHIPEGINQIGSFGPNVSTMLVYNIVNFPSETEADYEELCEVVASARPKYMTIFILHSTPFRPSIATPMQWEAVRLFPNWSKKRATKVIDRNDLLLEHSFTIETPWSHLISIVAERATPDDDGAIEAIVHSPRLKALRAEDALNLFSRNFNIERYTREMDIDGPGPTPWLEGYIPNATLRKIAKTMRSKYSKPR